MTMTEKNGDKKSKKKPGKKGERPPVDWMGMLSGAVGAMMYDAGKSLLEEEEGREVAASRLSPGMVIRVGHVNVMVLGVRLAELADTERGGTRAAVQVAGAHATDRGIDWCWDPKKVQWDSPFLQFKPSQRIRVIREAVYDKTTLETFVESDAYIQTDHYKKGVDIGERVGKEKGYELCFADVRKVLAHRLDQHPTKDGDDPHDIGFNRGIDFVFSTLLGNREEFFKLLDMINKEARGTEDAPAPPPQEDRPYKQGGSSQLFREKLD